MFNFNYPVVLTPAEEGGFSVSFPDVPEALTQGEDEAEALMRAVDALETALEFYTDGNEDLPKASSPKRGQETVRPSALACIKLALYQGMREKGVRKSDLARLLSVHMPQVDRLLDLGHASRLGLAENALSALGYELQISVSSAQPTTKAAPAVAQRQVIVTTKQAERVLAKRQVPPGVLKRQTPARPVFAAATGRAPRGARK